MESGARPHDMDADERDLIVVAAKSVDLMKRLLDAKVFARHAPGIEAEMREIVEMFER